MRRYESVFILNPELSEENHQNLFDKLTGLVSDGKGMFVQFDKWGHKRLAYEVKKQTRGYYVLMDFCGDGALVKEIERNLRLDDRVLKYMTVQKDKVVDLEAINEEIAAARQREAQAEAARQAPAASEDGGKPPEAAPAVEGDAAPSEGEAVEAAPTGTEQPQPAETQSSEDTTTTTDNQEDRQDGTA